MPLKLMYITNIPDVARIAESAGVDRIFVDMEYIGKQLRQKGMNTVQSHHTVEDIIRIRQAVSKSELLVRCNPIHDQSDEFSSTETEINSIVDAGADIIMLPYFKTVDEVRRFINAVDGRATSSLLFETPEAVENIDDILKLDGIDEVHIGINDLSLGYGKKFMFELLADGTVEKICNIFKAKGIPYGFGGIASLGKGILPAEYVIREHYRLGSSCAILSRSFCNTADFCDYSQIDLLFKSGVSDIRAFEEECKLHSEQYEESRKKLIKIVEQIVC